MLLATAGAVGFASKGVFAKILYAHGVSYAVVLVLRSSIAVPVMWLWVLAVDGAGAIRATPRRALIWAACAGIVCYFLGAILDFFALTRIDASLERVILFSYPSMVVLAQMLLGRGNPTPRTVLALALTYVGIFLSVGGTSLDLARANALGAFDVLLCAASYALYFLISERYVARIGSGRFALYAMSAAAIAMNLAYGARFGWRGLRLEPRDWLTMAGLVAFATVLPMFMVAEGVRRIGAQRSALAGTIGPVATLVLASILLGERPRPAQLAGTALIVAGILVLELRGAARSA